MNPPGRDIFYDHLLRAILNIHVVRRGVAWRWVCTCLCVCVAGACCVVRPSRAQTRACVRVALLFVALFVAVLAYCSASAKMPPRNTFSQFCFANRTSSTFSFSNIEALIKDTHVLQEVISPLRPGYICLFASPTI